MYKKIAVATMSLFLFTQLYCPGENETPSTNRSIQAPVENAGHKVWLSSVYNDLKRADGIWLLVVAENTQTSPAIKIMTWWKNKDKWKAYMIGSQWENYINRMQAFAKNVRINAYNLNPVDLGSGDDYPPPDIPSGNEVEGAYILVDIAYCLVSEDEQILGLNGSWLEQTVGIVSTATGYNSIHAICDDADHAGYRRLSIVWRGEARWTSFTTYTEWQNRLAILRGFSYDISMKTYRPFPQELLSGDDYPPPDIPSGGDLSKCFAVEIVYDVINTN